MWKSGALAAGVMASGLAFAQSSADVREKIEVTGSNIKRIDGETGLPVTTFTRAEIERTGATTAAELLDKVSAIGAGGFNIQEGLGKSGAQAGLSAVSLRGLGSSNTLVLLNGHRLANFAFNGVGGGTVNINQIPLAAIERVEVLKDGASAIYGTDAIGGVVNFILRKDYRGAEASAYGAWTEDGGGAVHRFTATAGFGDIAKDRFNILGVVDYQGSKALAASQREFASTGVRPDLGLRSVSSQPFVANFGIPGFGQQRFSPLAAGGCAPALGLFPNPSSSRFTANACTYDFTSVLEIYPPSERAGVFLRAVSQLAADHQGFVEVHWAHNRITFAASETPVPPDSGFVYPVMGPYYPSTITLVNGAVIHPAGPLSPVLWRVRSAGLRRDEIVTDEWQWVAGLQGVLAGWDYDATVSRARSNASDNYLDGFLRRSLLAPAFNGGLINPFTTGAQSPEAQAAIEAAKIFGSVRDSDSRVTQVSAKASRELAQFANGPLLLAVGMEYRKEDIEERPQEPLYSGDILGGGGPLPPTTRAGRDTASFFAEVDVSVLKNLEAQLAFRHDRFSDFGNALNPKVALRWTPAKPLLMRASYGTGVRAPTLSDLYLPLSAGNDAEERFDPARCPNGNPLGDFVSGEECSGLHTRFGGNPAVQPEKSRQWGAGAVFEPAAGTSLGVDYWTIRRRDSIQSIPEDVVFETYGVADPVSAGGRFVRRARLAGGSCAGDIPGFPTPPGIPCAIDYVLERIENLGKYNASGIDVTASLRIVRAAWGTMNVRVEGTYFSAFRYQRSAGGPYFDNAGRATPENGGVSRWRHYASIDWKRGAWGATLAQSFVNGYADDAFGPGGDALPPRRVASYEAYDVQARWDGWKGFKIAAGVRNLFNRDPPASRHQNTFQLGYDARYFDPRGRTFYVTIAWRKL